MTTTVDASDVARAVTPGTLTGFLLGGEPPPLEVIRAARLGAWAYHTLPADHPLRPQLRGDFLESVARHHRIRADVIPLLRAWGDAGIDVLPFKGFWLSETIYPAPGLRFHGDVDLAIRPADVARAAEAAIALGWRIPSDPALASKPWAHMAFALERAGGAARIDVHRLVVHSRTRWDSLQRRITDAFWARARVRGWEGLSVHDLDPADAMLLLMLQRAWGDNWGVKPADVLDMRLLIQREPGARDDLLRRADDLGCRRTVDLMLERCDPVAPRLELGRVALHGQVRAAVRVAAERPTLLFEKPLRRIRNIPPALADVFRVAPVVLRAWRAIRRPIPIPDLLASFTPPRAAPDVKWSPYRTLRGIRWTVRLMRLRPEGACLIRSLAVFHELRRHGSPAQFVTGIRRAQDGIQSHAWVELDGRNVTDGTGVKLASYSESFRYPAG